MSRSSGGSRNSKKGIRNRGSGAEVPQRGPWAEPWWGSGAKPPKAMGIMLHSQLTTSENFNTETYTTRQKQDELSARN